MCFGENEFETFVVPSTLSSNEHVKTKTKRVKYLSLLVNVIFFHI